MEDEHHSFGMSEQKSVLYRWHCGLAYVSNYDDLFVRFVSIILAVAMLLTFISLFRLYAIRIYRIRREQVFNITIPLQVSHVLADDCKLRLGMVLSHCQWYTRQREK